MNTLFNKLAQYVLLIVFITACSESSDPLPTLGIAFETTGVGIDGTSNTTEVGVSFSRATEAASTLTISLSENGVVYGQDYETSPAASAGQIQLSVPAGVQRATFTITRLVDAISAGNTVDFTLSSITGIPDAQITGNTSLTANFEAIASPGSSLVAEIGGDKQPNQVFIDFSLNKQVTAERISWDLGFYTGSEDKVVLNYSTYGMALATSSTDINSVSAADTAGISPPIQIGTAGADVYIDHPDRDLSKLAIADISSTDTDNVVYIINRGGGPGTGNVDPGSVDVGSTPRGWKKIRILKSGDDYIVQYADLDATTFEQTTISKNTDFNFIYFSFDNGQPVSVEPQKDQWDIVMTVSSNIINFGAGDGAYGFSDFVLSNRQGGVQVASVQLTTDEDGNINPGQTTYDDFTASNLNSVTFNAEGNTIGSSWRSVFTRTANNNVFFIVKDAEGNNYKLQFLGLLDENGIRGNSSLKYELL